MRPRHDLSGLVCVFAFFFAGCGADMDYKQGRHLEENGEPFRAREAYEEFIQDYPDDARVTEVRYRTGRIYAQALERCEDAVPLFESAARDHSPANKQWAKRARQALMTCPDFFPLRMGATWRYVDTLSGGKNMSLTVGVKASTEGIVGEIAGAMYAGKTFVQKYQRTYDKSEWAVFETIEGKRAPILKYPFRKGRSWTATQGGRRESFTIVAERLEVRVRAGRYRGCLKVKRKLSGFPSWVYDYYCPGVGRVKTSIGVPGRENPNTELAEYQFPGKS